MVAEANAWASDESEARIDALGGGKDAMFGWERHVDPATKRVFQMHTYTGEVRWTSARDGASARVDTPKNDPWDFGGDPLYPHRPQLVMLPTGITPSHPVSSRLDSWRGGYDRFRIKESAIQDAFPTDLHTSGAEPVQRRVLPCTWEHSNHGPPFLGPFPVAIMQPTWVQDSNQSTEWFPNPPVVNVYQAPMPPPTSPPAFAPTYYSPVAPFPNYDEHQHPGVHEFGAACDPQFVDKAHNRRGYNIRQARKMMKELGLRSNKPKRVVPQTGIRPCSPGPQPLHQSSTNKSSTRGNFPPIAPALRPQTSSPAIRVN